MITRREFEVVYQAKAGGAPVGDWKTLKVICEREAEAEKIFAKRAEVISIKQLRVVIDPDQNIFNKEEAAEYMRSGVDKIDELMGRAILPRAREGFPKFTRAQLDYAIAQMMTDVEERKAA